MKPLSDTTVLMTADAVGGVWTFATRLAAGLAANGANIHLLTMGTRPRADQRAMLSDSPVRLIESDLALEWQDPEGADVPRARDMLVAVACDIEADLVHLNSYREATFDWSTPVIVTAHSCVNSWALACNDTSWLSEPRWQRYTGYVAAGLDRAAAWVAPTQAFRDVMHDLYRPHIQGKIIRNGSAAAGEQPEKKPFILAAGRMWDTAKNLTALSAAAKGVDWPTVVAGATSEPASTSASKIAFTGELSHAELNAQMRRAAIFVSPARYEPFGLSVLEAASAGCALVLSDIPTFRELWDGCASFVDPGDCDALRATVNELCADASRRETLQHAAAARARRYTSRRMVEGYAALYESLMTPAEVHSATEACA